MITIINEGSLEERVKKIVMRCKILSEDIGRIRSNYYYYCQHSPVVALSSLK